MIKTHSRKARVAAAAVGVAAVAAGSVFGINTVASAATTDTAVTKLSVKKGTSVAGTAVTITGKNFTGTIANTDVMFGATAAVSIIQLSSTQIVAVAPAGTGGATVQVKVTANTIASADTVADDYTYVSPLTVDTATGTVLNPLGKTDFVVTSSGLGADAAAFKALKITAKVNGVLAKVAWKTSTTATVTAPAGTPSDTGVPVVLNIDGVVGTPDASAATEVKYGAVITKLSKTSGPLVGVDTIVVTGKGLGGATAAGWTFGAGNGTATCNQTGVPTAKLDTTWNCPVPTAVAAGAVTVVPPLSVGVGATNYGTLAGATYTFTNV